MADNTEAPLSQRRPQIKSVSRVTSSTFGRLKAARCFAEIDRRLRLGWSSQNLAKAIHEEFNELEDASRKYLKKLIERYRAQIPPAELSMSANSVISRNAVKKLANGLDELAEIERLYAMQMERVDIDLNNERKIQKLLPQTGQEIAIAAKLLQQSSDLKMDLGLVKKQIGTLEITGQIAAEVTDRYNEGVGKVMADPDSRRKVLGLAEKIMAFANKNDFDPSKILSAKPVIEAESSEGISSNIKTD